MYMPEVDTRQKAAIRQYTNLRILGLSLTFPPRKDGQRHILGQPVGARIWLEPNGIWKTQNYDLVVPFPRIREPSSISILH